MQWIQYSIIANIVRRYYNVTNFQVDMTSMIYMITYIPLIFPASYLLDKLVSNYNYLTKQQNIMQVKKKGRKNNEEFFQQRKLAYFNKTELCKIHVSTQHLV